MLINNLLFAKSNEYLAGEFLVSSLSRVCEWLQDQAQFLDESWQPQGVVAYKLWGSENALKQACLKLSLHVKLTTICQRCLNEMPCELALDFNYLIVPEVNIDATTFDEEGDTQDDVDLLPASQAMSLIVLIEDEVILALPISPLHASSCIDLTLQSGEKPNPFAVLKKLIKP